MIPQRVCPFAKLAEYWIYYYIANAIVISILLNADTDTAYFLMNSQYQTSAQTPDTCQKFNGNNERAKLTTTMTTFNSMFAVEWILNVWYESFWKTYVTFEFEP